MRLTLGFAGLVTLAFGCRSTDVSQTTPPSVATPKSGDALDRCSVLVRFSAPGQSIVPSSTGAGVPNAGHVDWRVNGGPSNEVLRVADRDPVSPFLLGAVLVPGANHLEIGSCDSVDTCGWSAVDLTVAQRPGSPDCAFAGTGQPVITQQSAALDVLPLTDGRAIAAMTGPSGMALQMFRADGSADPSFGTKGLASLGAALGRAFVVALADGSFEVVTAPPSSGAYYVHVTASGLVDPKGLQPVAFAGTASANVVAVALAASGDLLLVGGAISDATKPTIQTPFATELGLDGTPRKTKLLDDGQPKGEVIGADIDATGRFAVALEDRVDVGSLDTGLDTTFGGAGYASLPNAGFAGIPWPGSVALLGSGGGVAVAQVAHATGRNVAVRVFDGRGHASPDFGFPLGDALGLPVVMLRPSADGALYVAGERLHPADPSHDVTPDAQPGSDLIVARYRSGVLDATYGAAGVSTVWFGASFPAAADNPVWTTPSSLRVDGTGAAWIGGGSGTYEPNPDSLRIHGGATVVRLKG